MGQSSICFNGLSVPPHASYSKEELKLSKMGFGVIMSTLYFGKVFAAFPSGRLTDIFGAWVLVDIDYI
jgi:hypothetical protein